MSKVIDQTGATVNENPMVRLSEQLNGMADKWRASLPAHISIDRFQRVVIMAVQSNPGLVYADRFSLWQSCGRAAHDGLLPDGKEGALVVFKTKVKRRNDAGNEVEVWIDAVQWMPMIAGIRKKVRNSGEVKEWNAYVVYEKDEFDYELGDTPFIKHKPYFKGDRGEIVAAYSIAHLDNGEVSREVMSRADIDRIRAVSKSPDSPAWKKWFDEMARKCVARRHSKVLPMSTDIDELIHRQDDFETAAPETAPARPSLSSFMDTKVPDQIIEGDGQPDKSGEKKADTDGKTDTKSDTKGEKGKPDDKDKTDEKAKEETGEGTKDEHSSFSAADAYTLGEEYRRDGKSKGPDDYPKDLAEEHREAFAEGYKAEDERLKAVKGSGAKGKQQVSERAGQGRLME